MRLSQTLFTRTDLGNRLITLTVTDVSGNTSTEKAEVLIRDPQGVCPCSYGVLATDRIVMRRNEVFAGGIGITSSKGKVKLGNTVVNREGTFVRAPQTRFDSESESSTYFRGQAPQPESFRKNSGKDKGKEKKEEEAVQPEIRLSISPNPASEYLHVEAFCPSGQGELTLTDRLGNVLIRKTLSSAQSVQDLDIRTLAPGIYIIRLNDKPKPSES